MKILPLLALLALLIPAAHAQESTATSPLATEASWSALKSLTEQANNNARTAHIRLDQMEKCNNQKKLYAPKAEGADADGCISVQTHMHWNRIQLIGVAASSFYNKVTVPASISSAHPACGSVGEKPVQMNFCTTLGRTCYTTVAPTSSCSNIGSGTGCNGTSTSGNISVWQCM